MQDSHMKFSINNENKNHKIFKLKIIKVRYMTNTQVLSSTYVQRQRDGQKW